MQAESPLSRAERNVAGAAATLHLAVATARRERLVRGYVSPELWAVIDSATIGLEQQLDELERLTGGGRLR